MILQGMILSFFVSLSGWAQTPKVTHRYYLEFLGDPQLTKLILEELTSKACHTLKDLDPASTSTDCHSFAALEKSTILSAERSFLLKVIVPPPKNGSPKNFAVQGFKMQDGRMVKYLVPGVFKVTSAGNSLVPPNQHFAKEAASTLVRLSFK